MVEPTLQLTGAEAALFQQLLNTLYELVESGMDQGRVLHRVLESMDRPDFREQAVRDKQLRHAPECLIDAEEHAGTEAGGQARTRNGQELFDPLDAQRGKGVEGPSR